MPCGLTRGRTRRGPASARRPSRLVQRYLNGVTPLASRASNAGRRRAAAASARGPWPRGLTSGPLGRPRSRSRTFPPPDPEPTRHSCQSVKAKGQKGGRLTAASLIVGQRQVACSHSSETAHRSHLSQTLRPKLTLGGQRFSRLHVPPPDPRRVHNSVSLSRAVASWRWLVHAIG